jgi:hypothetical protein
MKKNKEVGVGGLCWESVPPRILYPKKTVFENESNPRGLKQEDHEFKVSLSYILNSRS